MRVIQCVCGHRHDDDDDDVPSWVPHLFHRLDQLLQGVMTLSDQSQEIEDAAAQIDADIASLGTEIAAEIAAAVAAVQNQNPGVDLSPITNAVGRLDALVTANQPAPAPVLPEGMSAPFTVPDHPFPDAPQPGEAPAEVPPEAPAV